MAYQYVAQSAELAVGINQEHVRSPSLKQGRVVHATKTLPQSEALRGDSLAHTARGTGGFNAKQSLKTAGLAEEQAICLRQSASDTTWV